MVPAVTQVLSAWAGQDSQRQLEVDGLLGWLSTFDVTSTADLKASSSPNPLVAVAANLISRGLPTLPSVRLEQYLADELGMTVQNNKAQLGAIKFPFAAGREPTGAAVFQALHIVVPQQKETELRFEEGALDSGFELWLGGRMIWQK